MELIPTKRSLKTKGSPSHSSFRDSLNNKTFMLGMEHSSRVVANNYRFKYAGARLIRALCHEEDFKLYSASHGKPMESSQYRRNVVSPMSTSQHSKL